MSDNRHDWRYAEMLASIRDITWLSVGWGCLFVCAFSLANDTHIDNLKGKIATGQPRIMRSAIVPVVKRDRNLHPLIFYTYKDWVGVVEV